MRVPKPKWRTRRVADDDLDHLSRTAHSATLVGNKVYVLGGLSDGYLVTTDFMILDLVTRVWRTLTFPNIAEDIEEFALHAHTATLVNDRLIIIGGCQGVHESVVSDVVYSFDTVLEEFRVVQTKGSPKRGAVEFHTANLMPDSNEIIVYGGQTGDMDYVEHPLFTFNAVSMMWTALRWQGQRPQLRANHSTCLVDMNLFIMGGFSHNSSVLNDLHILDLRTRVPAFSQPKLTWAPTRRFGTALVAFGGHLFLYGGRTSLADGDDELRLSDLHRFDIAKEQWYECPSWTIPSAPVPCSNHKPVPLHDTILIIGGTSVNITTYMEISFDYD